MTPEEIVTDFRKRYEGTFIYVQEPNSEEENLFYVRSVQASDERVGVLNLESDEIGKIRLNFGSAHTLKFPHVPVGVFQYGARAVMCRRRPIKQWRKGICSDNTSIVPTTHKLYDFRFPFDFALVMAAFTNTTFTLKEALAKLASMKYQSVALNNYFSLSQSFTRDSSYVLFFWDAVVAKISPEGKLVLVCDKVFEPQVEKFLHEEGFACH